MKFSIVLDKIKLAWPVVLYAFRASEQRPGGGGGGGGARGGSGREEKNPPAIILIIFSKRLLITVCGERVCQNSCQFQHYVNNAGIWCFLRRSSKTAEKEQNDGILLSTTQIPPLLRFENTMGMIAGGFSLLSPSSSPPPGALFAFGPVSRTDIYRKPAALRSLGKHTKPPATQAKIRLD